MKSVLVTGASGFIGQRLCERLSMEGWKVTGTIRSPGQALFLPTGVKPVDVGTIGPDTNWLPALQDIDAVVHLAARVHILKETVPDPIIEYRRVNVLGTQKLASMAIKARVTSFVFLSSIGVNGEQTDTKPFSESDIPSPQQPYAVSKFEAEQTLMTLSASTGMRLVILRPPLVYGPGVKGNMQSLLDYVYKQVPLPFGAIKNQRSLIGIENLVDAILRSLEHSKSSDHLFLISDDQDISTTELINKIALYMGKKPALMKVPEVIFHMASKIIAPLRHKLTQLTASLVIDGSKFSSTMKWTPPCSLDEGIMSMVHAYLTRKESSC